ncbi:hypothetical protein KW782_04495 [Candidatus Parcubacteria bacterium]|nr:hypothetical protein [Candidatus Parcubacteria bacterium]
MGIRKYINVIVYLFAAIGFILVVGYFAVKFGWTNVPGIIDRQNEYFQQAQKAYSWAQGEEWNVFKEAVIRDKEALTKAGMASDSNPRLIVAQLIVEQLRLYHTNRELFKTVFAPLKLLGNQSQFSWGVMGLKQETAVEIENHLKDSTSSFYLGKKYENLLDFTTTDHNKERFDRIINEHDRYYSYLYAALYLKQIETQWKNAGFDISDRPEILSTLFNIGFKNSHPNHNPQVGGAEIEIKGKTYSFGGLASEFYASSELEEAFAK